MKTAGKISIFVLLVITLLSVFAPVVSRYGPDRIDLDSLKIPPDFEHPLGTDNKGRDILSRVLYGGRISISIAVTAALISMGIGLFIGLVSGYFGGRTDTVIMAFVDLVLSFPSLLLAIGISILLPPGIYTVMIAIVAVGWASFARIIRGYVLTLREATYIEAAMTLGCSNRRILFNTSYASMRSSPARYDGDENRRIYHNRGFFKFFRPWRSASDGNMGVHDKREQGLYNFGSLDGLCPRLYDRPDVSLFQYTRGQLKR